MEPKQQKEENREQKHQESASTVIFPNLTEEMPSTPIITGYNFLNGNNFEEILQSYYTLGCQAQNFGKAVKIINNMINWRLEDDPAIKDYKGEQIADEYFEPEVRKNYQCRVFLGCTGSVMTSGVRDSIRYLCEHKMIDMLVMTADAFEIDMIKCLSDIYIDVEGSFEPQKETKGMRKRGNICIPHKAYSLFSQWFMKLLPEMVQKQQKEKFVWTPRKIIKHLGLKMNNKQSASYWAAKNDIEIMCPAFNDGFIGQILFYINRNINPKNQLQIDIIRDIKAMNKYTIQCRKSGVIILGGGVVKHHILNSNMMRNGANFAVYINCAQEFDCSDAGARPEEALSWGKLRFDCQFVKIYTEVSLVFPLIVSQTFVKNYKRATKLKKE